MYLKSIEVQGFKSFANKITFEFHNGITGIVGPNGSGKSNVADAVRWVLGEQRVKQLRGASMQDVIFAGTENRKPLGYAYVAITLDNADRKLGVDYEEVTVARRVYRSGESEYMINGTHCRLKDVNELFYDTGIGKEGYSIIGQGQIERILSGKPEERRELFDEAAGIVKFKRRKAAALKKLEEEQNNLVRVSDILSELEKQVAPLERQSEKAREYLKKKEALKTLDINMFLMESERLKTQLGEVEDKLTIAENDLQDTTGRFENAKEEYEKIASRLEELEKDIEEKRKELSDAGLLRGKLEGEINVLKEQINSANANDAHLRQRMEAVAEEIAVKEKDLEQILSDKASTDAQLSALEEQRDAARAAFAALQEEITGLNEGIERDKNTIIGTLNDRAGTKTKIGRYDTMLEQVQIRKAQLNSRLLRAKSDEAEQQEQAQGCRQALLEVNSQITDLENKSAVIEEQIDEIKGLLAEQDKQLNESQIRYHKDKSNLDTLKNLAERYDGYGNSIRRVMEQREKQKGILGVVADLIQVDKQYEVAVETALGGSIQNIVTENEETAKAMIGFLKQNKFGRATFLPLTSMRRREFQTPQALKEPGVIGVAANLVTTSQKFEVLVAQLLGGILVVDNIDNAVRIAKKYRYSLRMVTVEGELFNPGGAMTGGAFRNSSNLLGRKREIEELERRVKARLTEIDALLNEMESQKERRKELREESERLKQALQQQFIVQNTARINVEQAEEKIRQTAQGYQSLEEESRELDGQVKDIEESKQEILKELADSEHLEKELTQRIEERTKSLEAARAKETEQSAALDGLNLEVANLSQTRGFKQENTERLTGEIGRLQTEREEIGQSMEAAALEMAKKQEDIEALKKTIAASDDVQDGGEELLKELTETRESLNARQKSFFTVREELSERRNSLDKEIFRLNSQKERLEENQEAQINYMWNEYEITLGAAIELRDEAYDDLASVRKEIAGLKEEIKKLGDVNVNAIEDYKALMERYTFLKEQHDDLIEAEKTLEGIIEELDTSMRRQFEEKFSEIREQFDKVFKEMFGGGKGTLELMEGEDILEAGVRIVAQPPGKKLQNMMQLSGGEKALTAIALLFAIQNLKPSPFCLLDEIEAALDESNVGRFAGYLHKLTRHTQFIVITHRRGTMERADRLYGITMQEKGVSALVSVNLIDKDLEE